MTRPLVPGADGCPEPSPGEAEMSHTRDTEDPMLWAERPMGSGAEGKAHLQGWGTPALGGDVIQLGGQSRRGGLRRSGNREQGLGEKRGSQERTRHPCIPTHRSLSHLAAFPEAAHGRLLPCDPRPMLVLPPPLPTEYLQRAKGLSWVRDFR